MKDETKRIDPSNVIPKWCSKKEHMRGTTLPLELHQYRIASNYIAQETALTVTPLNHLLSSHCLIFTVRKRSLRGLCFDRCLYVHGGCLCPERGRCLWGVCLGGPLVRILLECILVSLVCFWISLRLHHYLPTCHFIQLGSKWCRRRY